MRKTLRLWHKKQIDQIIPASIQDQRIKELESKNKELKQAN